MEFRGNGRAGRAHYSLPPPRPSDRVLAIRSKRSRRRGGGLASCQTRRQHPAVAGHAALFRPAFARD